MGVALAVIVLATGCGNREANAAKGSGQVAAKVNKEEISVHQLNFVLQRTPGVTQANADAASRQILERLIGQELAVQQAQELKLDRTPAVVQALEAARREVLARAYMDKLGEGIAKPTPSEISEFYTKRPALFKQRKLYTLQDATVAGTDAELAQVRERASAPRSAADFANWLRGSGLRHQVGQAITAAENVPLESLDRLAGLADGQSIIAPVPGGLRITTLVRSESAPIEQFITNERRRQKVDADMKALRATARIEFVGKFAEPATGAAAAPVAAAAPTAPAASAAPGSLGDDALKKGLGLR
jgi:EpsD family peptidyl-prolyl cis-trans isomerase